MRSIDFQVAVLLLVLAVLFIQIASAFLSRYKERLTGKLLADAGQTQGQDSYCTDPKDRRRVERAEIKLEAQGRIGDKTVGFKTCNLSLSGAFISCPNTPLPLGTHFSLTISMPDGTPLAVEAEVIWGNTTLPTEKVVNRGVGIRFLHQSETVRKQLLSFFSDMTKQTTDKKDLPKLTKNAPDAAIIPIPAG
ncbi:MAG: PilZ domain-containing protein [Proteobacteria bacterium]|nr:PilZ domain-containing protein [Pseudomonadota bacterium]MBU1686768.1 PilZ domain-containing protein [Pseudomonadota bacterium]